MDSKGSVILDVSNANKPSTGSGHESHEAIVERETNQSIQ